MFAASIQVEGVLAKGKPQSCLDMIQVWFPPAEPIHGLWADLASHWLFLVGPCHAERSPLPVDPFSTKPAQGMQASAVALRPSSSTHHSSWGSVIRKYDADKHGMDHFFEGLTFCSSRSSHPGISGHLCYWLSNTQRNINKHLWPQSLKCL